MIRHARFVFLLLVVSLLAGKAAAHTGFENTTEIRVFPDRMRMVVRISYAFAWKMLGERAPATMDAAGQALAQPLLLERASGFFDLSAGGVPLAHKTSKCLFELNDDVAFVLTYDRPKAWPLVAEARFFHLLGSLDSGTISVFDESTGRPDADIEPVAGKVLFSNDTVFSYAPAAVNPVAGEVVPPAPALERPGFGRFFRLGIEHIVTGYDHLLFLLAVLLGCRSSRAVLLIITAFTLAHSVTLALATFDLVQLPSRWVESFIALSIAYMGLENFRKGGSLAKRICLTSVFGLIHGLGFAGLLREIGVGADGQSAALPLLAFNLGVESGQLAIVALMLPVWLALRRIRNFERIVIPALSSCIIILGGIWFFQRAFSGG
jgi:hydrogenase/urease accessory protein HupE